MNSINIVKVAALAGVLALAACGGGPSDADVEDAARQQVLQALEQQRQTLSGVGFGGAAASSTFREMERKATEAAAKMEVDVGEITELPDGTYSAVVTTTSNGQVQTTTMRLAETKDGWSIVQ